MGLHVVASTKNGPDVEPFRFSNSKYHFDNHTFGISKVGLSPANTSNSGWRCLPHMFQKTLKTSEFFKPFQQTFFCGFRKIFYL